MSTRITLKKALIIAGAAVVIVGATAAVITFDRGCWSLSGSDAARGVSTTAAPTTDPEYWTPERMRSAQPVIPPGPSGC